MAQGALPPDLVRRGWNSETSGLRSNLRRELEFAEQYTAAARRALDAGTVDAHSLRQLASAAAEAHAYGAALAAVNRVAFALPDETEE